MQIMLGMMLSLQYGSLSGPFAPVVDGVILPDTPINLRNAKKQMKVKVLAGLTKDEGAYYACTSSCLLTSFSSLWGDIAISAEASDGPSAQPDIP